MEKYNSEEYDCMVAIGDNAQELRSKDPDFSSISSFWNTFGGKAPKLFGDNMAQQHPTIQQNFMRTVLEFLKALNCYYNNNYYDDRNDASVKLAHALWEVVKLSEYYNEADDDVYLPFI